MQITCVTSKYDVNFINSMVGIYNVDTTLNNKCHIQVQIQPAPVKTAQNQYCLLYKCSQLYSNVEIFSKMAEWRHRNWYTYIKHKLSDRNTILCY